MPRPPTAAPAGADPPAERLFSDRLGKRAARGDQRAFEAIFKRYHQELYRYCLSIVRDREDAEDALQATMAAALRSLPGEERVIALRPWLYRVAHNESISLLRGRTQASDAEPEEELEALTGSVPAEAEQRARLRRLVSDLQTLPERQRSAIVMRELNDLSYAEIGAGLDCSEAAARQTVYEARSALFTFEEGRSMDCEPIREAISSRDGRRLRGRKVRAHLRVCERCRDFEAVIAQRRDDMQALFPPLPALAASGILAGLVGSGGGATVVGAGATGAGAAGAGSGIFGSGIAGGLAIKGASLVAATAVAAGAADLGGVIDLPNPFTGNDSDPARKSGGSDGGGTAGASDDAGGASSEPAGAAGSSAGGSAAGAEHANGGANSNGNGNSTEAGNEGGRGGSAAAPGQAGQHGGSAAAPGQTGTSPGQAGTSPGQAGTTPGQSGSSPGKSESAPGHSSESSPGNSSSAPGHTGEAPGKSGSAPGDAPGNSGSAPGHTESSSPGNSGSAPGQVKDAGEPAAPPAKPPKVTTPPAGGPPAENPGKGNGPDVGLPPVVGDLAGAAGGLVATPGN